MTQQQAKELCILKWQYIVDNNGCQGGLCIKHPELSKLLSNCGYCEIYYNTHSINLLKCLDCPIRPEKENYNNLSKEGCLQKCHPYFKWYTNQTVENAQSVLDLIIKN